MEIEFPIEVSSIDTTHLEDALEYKPGLVSVRPCAEEYQDKTYVGFLLGSLIVDVTIGWDPETKKLSLFPYTNPAIFVPELNKIIFGYESWWGRIKNPEDLKAITDDDIMNVWYVKALMKEAEKRGKEEKEESKEI